MSKIFMGACVGTILLSLVYYCQALDFPNDPVLPNPPFDTTPKRHDRYYSGGDKDFIGDEYASGTFWSGIGEKNPYGNHKLNMLTNRCAVGAWHVFKDVPNGTKFRFYYDNDTDTWTEHAVESRHQIGTTDVCIVKLATAPPAAIQRYKIFAPYALRNVEGWTVLYVGQSKVGYDINSDGLSQARMAIGLNEVTNVDTNWVSYYYVNSAFGPDLARGEEGDSGTGTFFMCEGQPYLLGFHYFTLSDVCLCGEYLDDIISTVQSVAGETVQTFTNLPGDTNLDGEVDTLDSTVWVANYTGMQTDPPTYDKHLFEGDCDGDGDVDQADYNLMIINWTGN